MTTSTHCADTSKDGGRIDTTRAVMEQALEALEAYSRWAATIETEMQALNAITALRAALAEQKCPCGDRRGDQCPGEWEPGCDLGANEKHVKVAEQVEPVADAARVIEWATSTPRKAAVHAFTEGPERQAAYWIEWAEARVVNRRLTTEQAQPAAIPEGYEPHELPADYTGKLWIEGQVRALARTSPAHQPVHGWTDADADAARLALELECLLTDKDVPLSAASRWWDSAHEALRLHRERLAAAPEAPVPVVPQPLTDEDIDAFVPVADGTAEADSKRVEVLPGFWGVEYEEVAAWSLPLVRSIARAVEAEVLRRMGVQR